MGQIKPSPIVEPSITESESPPPGWKVISTYHINEFQTLNNHFKDNYTLSTRVHKAWMLEDMHMVLMLKSMLAHCHACPNGPMNTRSRDKVGTPKTEIENTLYKSENIRGKMQRVSFVFMLFYYQSAFYQVRCMSSCIQKHCYRWWIQEDAVSPRTCVA